MAVVFSAAAAGDLGGESRELQRLVSEGAKVPSALELGLYCLPFVHRDNCLVGVLDEILRQLTVILSAVFGDRVFAVFLLEKHIPGVGDVRQDKHYFVRKMDSFSFRMFDEFYNCASEILEQQQLMKNLQKNSLFLTQQMLMQSETNYILQILAMCAQNPVDVPTLLKTIEGSLPADASDEQKTAFENLMKRMTASNQNIDPNTFWNTYNQSKANLHSVINQNALTHYIPVQIRITLENALKKYNAIQVIGCEGYRKLKKIANRKF